MNAMTTHVKVEMLMEHVQIHLEATHVHVHLGLKVALMEYVMVCIQQELGKYYF